MKEIKQEVKKTETIIRYEANDGTIFDDRDECKKYDESAKGVLMSKYRKLVVRTENEYSVFYNCGCEDNDVDIVRIKTKEDADLLKQIFFFINPYYKDKPIEGYVKIELDTIDKALKEKDVLFIGRGYEGDCFWIYGSAATMIESIANYRKLEKETENG